MDTEANSGFRWLQSKFVLSTARRVYLIVACFSLLAAILALISVLLFQLLSYAPAPEVPVPEARAPHAVAMDSSTVARSLAAPTNLRFVSLQITPPLGPNDVVGYFDADTPSGLAAFPEDFDIFGGTDAADFERAPVNVRFDYGTITRAGLKPSQDLLNKINQRIPVKPSFSVLVVARDRFGNVTKPQKVEFSLALEGARPAASPPREEMTDLQILAREIALRLDPNKTPVYFQEYDRAQRVPEHCGASPENADFVRGFADAFHVLKAKLNTGNILAFYAGVCAAWQEGVKKEQSEQQASDSARGEALAESMAAKSAYEMRKLSFAVMKHASLYAFFSALTVFLFISLFLAFLAIENHSDALRQAVQALAAQKRE